MCKINYQNWNSLWHKLGRSYSGKRCHGFWFSILLTKTIVHMILLHMKPFVYSIGLSMIGFVFFSFLDWSSLPPSCIFFFLGVWSCHKLWSSFPSSTAQLLLFCEFFPFTISISDIFSSQMHLFVSCLNGVLLI